MTVTGSAGGAVLALHRATHATLHTLTSRLADLGLTGSEINALACLAGCERATVGRLAAATATRPTTLTSVLDRLEHRGYLLRELDPADRRSFLLVLTEPGRAAADRVTDAISDLERRALAGFSSAERAAFLTLLAALTEVSP